MAKALLLFHRKRLFGDGAIMEMRIWQVPDPVAASPHRLKYSLFYGSAEKRLVGYDNERGKGDHRHYGGEEERYRFKSPKVLIEDFLADVRRWRGNDL